MTGSDSEPGVLSEDSGRYLVSASLMTCKSISDHESEYSKGSDKDAISLREGDSDIDVDESAEHQQFTAEELIAGVSA